MATGALLQLPYLEISDDDGTPLAGGLVESYLAGTSTAQPLYADAGLTTVLCAGGSGAPLQLDAYGRAVAYTADVALKVIVKRADGSLVRSQDAVRFAPPVAVQAVPDWVPVLTW